ncbi:hypothetical protein NJB1728e18_00040, partial [Mycobacterium marinum]
RTAAKAVGAAWEARAAPARLAAPGVAEGTAAIPTLAPMAAPAAPAAPAALVSRKAEMVARAVTAATEAIHRAG